MSKNKNLKYVNVLSILFLSSLSQAENGVTLPKAPLIQVKDSRSPASELTTRQAGVPVFNFIEKNGTETVKVKNIPVLDIGQEKEIQAQEYTIQVTDKTLNLKEFVKKDSLEFIKINSDLTKYYKATIAKSFFPKDEKTGQTITSTVPVVNPLNPLPVYTTNDPIDQKQNLVEIKPDEYKMIQALIFNDFHKKYDLAMSLFVELMDVPQYKEQATFHYAVTALSQKLFSEFRNKMVWVATESKDETLKKQSVQSLVENIKHLEVSDIGKIDTLVDLFGINTVSYPAYLLKKAKYELDKGNLAEVENSLNLISSKTQEYKEGLLLKAIFNYRQGQLDSAISDLEILVPMIETDKKDEVRNLAVLTLARLYFQKSKYSDAYTTYLKVDKSSGQWLQSMVEQAWTQVLSGDNIGAAGNMFSLHTNYFKSAYAPDTYIVRSVGYLNLCQYGDGVNILGDLKKKYNPILDSVKSFQTKNTDNIKYYDLVKTWMKNPETKEIEGLPRSFVVELARHPHYTSIQKQINNYEDENSRFNKVTIDLIQKERFARLEMLKTKNALAAAKQTNSAKDIADAEKKYLALGTEHAIYAKAREGIKKMREAAVARLSTEKQDLVAKASVNLKQRFDLFASTLDSFIDQNEVLAYEIYSGAGEHIRYQMAGGTSGNVENRNLAEDSKNKNYEWKFKEEVWEDEIGHFRSSLKNVCPKEETTLGNQDTLPAATEHTNDVTQLENK